MPTLPFHVRGLLPLCRLVYNLSGRTRVADNVERRTETLADMPILVFTPRGPRSGAAVLWIHGGGHVVGLPEHVNRRASRIAAQTGALVFVPKYRLAPKHPYPADLDDCARCWHWILANAAALDLDPRRIAVAGNSAGGGLAAGLVNRLFDCGGIQPAAQVLLYPMLDDRTAADRSLDALRHFIWPNSSNRAAWQMYLAREPGAPDVPEYAAPARRSDLHGLPPTWIGLCELDLFAQENVTYAERLQAAGVDCQLYSVAGVPHAFDDIAPALAITDRFVRATNEFLLKHLGSGGGQDEAIHT